MSRKLWAVPAAGCLLLFLSGGAIAALVHTYLLQGQPSPVES